MELEAAVGAVSCTRAGLVSMKVPEEMPPLATLESVIWLKR